MKRAKDKTKKVPASKGVGKKPAGMDPLAMVDRIINDEREAERFFFDEMRPKSSALAESYNHKFGLDLSPEDVCVTTYLSCWEDDWARLRAFKGGTSIHGWVANIASQATFRFLVEEKYIEAVSGSKTSDYRLTVLSIDSVHLRQAIVDLVFVPEQHKALELRYVKKVGEKALAEAFGGWDNASRILKVADKTLIEQLLYTDNPFAERALSLKRAADPETRWQTWHDRVDEADVSDWQQALRDILCQKYRTEDWDANVHVFLESAIKGMHWSPKREDIFRAKFFSKVPSKVLAEKYNVQVPYIDNLHRTLNNEFRIALRAWWRNFNL